ncbi:MAG: YciI family protein [Nocardioides sp.]
MKFLVLMAEEDTWERWNALDDDEQQDVFGRFTAFTEAVRARGEVLAGEALDRTEHARTVRPGADRPVTDGPFAETVEQLGGFWLVDLPDLDTAVAAAKLLPDAYSVEVRPVVEVG